MSKDKPEYLWGDLGNGWYRNPVLYADFSDPDVIRVGNRYYMVASDFHFMGMQILESVDLINWRYVTQIYSRLDISEHYNNMDAYAHGSWAPSIRYHDGRFYVYFCTPREGLYMTSSSSPEGPWDPVHEVLRMENMEDPCPFWDDDGTAWLGRSTWGAGPIIIHEMSPDGRTLLDDGKIVYVGKVAEGTKIHKRNGWYYLSIPEGGVAEGWQTVLRSRHILGPYEKRITLSQGSTTVNGPHQGSVIDTPCGEYYFMHFQDRGAVGRVCHLQTLRWVDDWPVMGVSGEPQELGLKPTASTEMVDQNYCLTSSDDFSTNQLGPHWQWNHNPKPDHFWIDADRRELCIRSLPAMEISDSHNTLTQKLIGEQAWIDVRLDTAEMCDGQRAGLAFIRGKDADYIEVRIEENQIQLMSETSGYRSYALWPQDGGSAVYLGAHYDLHGDSHFYFGVEGVWHRLGTAIRIEAGQWKGCRPALYTYQMREQVEHNNISGGIARFGAFSYKYDRSMKQM